MLERFKQVGKIVRKTKPQIIVEAGGPKIAGFLLERCEEVNYWIFGGDKRAVTKLAKEYPQADIQHHAHAKLDEMTDANVVDVAVIHETKRMAADYEILKDARTVALDGFYEEKGRPLDKGCYPLIGDASHYVLPEKEGCQVVVLGETIKGSGNVVVKTKNCVPDTVIQGNIRYATTRIPKECFLPECEPHDEVVHLVSYGPSFDAAVPELKKRAKKGERIICVKTAHNPLIKAGIVPWGCMLLDPREDVLERISPLHPEVEYFVASMVCPKVVDALVDGGVKIRGYHALVGAGEMDVLREFDKRESVTSFALAGGSTAAIRGLSVLYSCGFRNFELWAYDSCYWEKPDMSKTTKTGQPYHCHVKVNGRDFWTDSQLLAQTQDFEAMVTKNLGINLTIHGDGLIPHVYQGLQSKKADFHEVFK